MKRFAAALLIVFLLPSCLVANPKSSQRLNLKKVPHPKPISTLAYGPDSSQALDVYAPVFWRPEDRRPAIVFVHGGAWVSGNKHDLNESIRAELRRGWVVISIDYRLSDRVDWPAPVQDVDRAIRYIRANAGILGIDPSLIVSAGHSSGAHLVLAQGLGNGKAEFIDPTLPPELQSVSSRPLAMIDMSGPVDLTMWLQSHWDGSSKVLNLLFGCDDSVFEALTCSPEQVASGSVVGLLDASDPPIYIAHGSKDAVVLSNQAQLLHGVAQMLGMDRRVWLDLVDTGSMESRGHFVDLGLNFATMELFLDMAITGRLSP